MATANMAMDPLRSWSDRMNQLRKLKPRHILLRIKQGMRPTEDEMQILMDYIAQLEEYPTLTRRVTSAQRRRNGTHPANRIFSKN